jgi:hypothetical protein
MDMINRYFLPTAGILFSCLLFPPISSPSQVLNNILGKDQVISDHGDARWITCPGISLKDHQVVYFRKSFDFDAEDSIFIIHISADNTYRLFVNGIFSASGPGKSDLSHWYYQTFNIAPLLKKGTNLLAVEVVNFGPRRAFAQFSHITGLYVQGRTSREEVINTSGNSWKVYKNEAYHVHDVQWINRKDITGGFYVANPTDSIVAEYMPWGWEKPDYDDSSWGNSIWLDNASVRETQGAGGIFYPGGWLLYPTPIRNLKEKLDRFSTLINEGNTVVNQDFIQGKADLVIPANTKFTILLDVGYMTVAYPEMILSGGKNGLVEARYSETLYNRDTRTKPDRNDFKDKVFVGIPDFYVPDGTGRQLFRPLSHRAFRLVQLSISTGQEPLTIHDYYNKAVGYPLELKGSFETSDRVMNKMMECGWRTASICAQDILMSDAYYEQMQYVGDSKVHNLTLLYLSGNDDLVRNMLRQTDWSRFIDGLTLACYPNGFHLVIPYYSLLWVDMVYDYMMWSGDKKFTSEMSWGIENVLHWYEARMQDNGLLGPLEWWNDVDWSPGYPNGTPPGIRDGNSATFSLQYSISLQNASKIFNWLGDPAKANEYLTIAGKINKAVRELCYDPSRGLFAETPVKNFFSQHTNILAVLSGAVENQEKPVIMKKVLFDKSLSEVALFFRYFLMEALKEAGMGDNIPGQLTPWRDMISRGLTTFTEIPVTWEGQRSDCHPWATAPNIHFYSSLFGIIPVTPGYERITINPSFGELKFFKGELPHKKGTITFELHMKGTSGVAGRISLPSGMTGSFLFNNSTIELKPGENKIEL